MSHFCFTCCGQYENISFLLQASSPRLVWSETQLVAYIGGSSLSFTQRERRHAPPGDTGRRKLKRKSSKEQTFMSHVVSSPSLTFGTHFLYFSDNILITMTHAGQSLISARVRVSFSVNTGRKKGN